LNPRIEKIRDEIEKIKAKMSKGQIRLRELEKQLTDLENADIVAAVRGVEIAPDEFADFVRMFKQKQQGSIVPDMGTAVMPSPGVPAPSNNNNDEEDSTYDNDSK